MKGWVTASHDSGSLNLRTTMAYTAYRYMYLPS